MWLGDTRMVLHEPDTRLTKMSRGFEWDKDTDNIDKLLKEYEKKRMQGLSAPQIGLNIRMFIIRVNKKPILMINPEPVWVFGKVTSLKEGCESVNGRYNVKRPFMGLVKYQNRKGRMRMRFLRFRWLRIFCHELDHLNGILISKKGLKVKC